MADTVTSSPPRGRRFPYNAVLPFLTFVVAIVVLVAQVIVVASAQDQTARAIALSKEALAQTTQALDVAAAWRERYETAQSDFLVCNSMLPKDRRL